MKSAQLLNDQSMQKFIREGYISVKVDLPQSFHDALYQDTEALFSSTGNPGNNLLPRLPKIQKILDHPLVHGALVSILGSDYYLHPHRHCHENLPNTDEQSMHKDSLHNSRFAVDDCHRHHHTRWAMAFYYPQHSPVEVGPTAIWPSSQYHNTQPPFDKADELALSGDAGTVVIVHYDVFHRKMLNCSDQNRYMMKFLFTRMSEPTEPSWNHQGVDWQVSDDQQEQIWQHLWNWHLGKQDGKQSIIESPTELSSRLVSDQEAIAIDAAYKLGHLGKSGLDSLIEATIGESNTACRNALYGFTTSGSHAVPSLTKLLSHPEPVIRTRAADTLGDMGLNARKALPKLVEKLTDENEKVRHHVAEALGTVSSDSPAAVEPLVQSLADKNDLVRRNAALSLARIGPYNSSAIPALTEALEDSNHFVRAFSLHALERNQTQKGMDALINHLRTARWCPSHR